MAPKNSVPGSQKTHCLFSTKTNWYILFKEIFYVYSENLAKHIPFKNWT
jgi:hypothetical protein